MRVATLVLCIQVGFLLTGPTFGQPDPLCTAGGAALSTNSYCRDPDPDDDCITKSNPSGFVIPDGTINDYIVSQHNMRRTRVALGAETLGNPGPQPPSKCMAKLRWNPKLAKAAQNWADQCIISGDTSRNKVPPPALADGGPYVGQNVYGYIDPLGTDFLPGNYSEWYYWDQAIQSWYGEVAKFDNTKVSSYAYNKDVGHYTQFVWGLTTEIGCGWRRSKISATDKRYIRLMVCNYWPGGNVAAKPVYDTAQTKACKCTDYPISTSTKDGRLCAPPPVCASLAPLIFPCLCGTGVCPAPGTPTAVCITANNACA